jgi:hypothetical protein
VSSTALPPGLLPLLKATTRDLVLAVGGPASVKELIGFSDGAISRCQGDAYPDLLPIWAVALLEFKAQQPVFARLLAGLTSHHVAPVEPGPGGEGNAGFLADLVGVVQGGADVTSTLGEALSDGQVTPREAKAVIGEIGALERKLTGTKRRLTIVVGRDP